MTEQEWLGCEDPTPMLEFLRGKASDRKLRLFAVACCRNIWKYMPHEQTRNATEIAERMADGLATNAERRTAALATINIEGGKGGAASCAVAVNSLHAAERASANAAYIFGSAVSKEPYLRNRAYNPEYLPALTKASGRERAAQTALLRDILGNPFRPTAPLDASLLTPHVLDLARDIYDKRSFDRMPELGRALRDAGCRDEQILGHCEQEGPHCRGCHVVDLLLGKE